jgi:hypothetical protein
MSREMGYKDWDKVVKACEKEFDLINNTRISMSVAEQCQKVTYELALKERAKYPEPKEEKKSDEGGVPNPS